MDVVKINKDGRRGIVVIPEKMIKDSYTLNLVLTEDDHFVAIGSDEFEKIGEIDD